MKIIKNIKNAVIASLLVLLVASGIVIDDTKKKLESANNLISNVEQAFEMYRKESGEVIIRQDQLIITKDQAIMSGLLEVERLRELNLREVQANIQLREKLEVLNKQLISLKNSLDTLNVEPPEVIIIDSIRYIEIPHDLIFRDGWLSLSVTVDSISVLNHLRLNNEHNFTLGWTGTGKWYKDMWKRPEPVIVYTNPNPYANATNIRNYIIQEQPKFYEKNIFWYSLGVGTVVILKTIF